MQQMNLSTLNGGQSGSDRPSTVPRLALRIVEFVVGALFVYAGLAKIVDLDHLGLGLSHLRLADPMKFALDIDNYKILPWSISVRLAFYLPWLEILCGAAVITRKLYRGGLSILAALTSVFIIASIVAKARGLDITCGCFGHASKYLSFAGHLALDLVILAALLVALFRRRENHTAWARQTVVFR
jgi:uncharacterized membrane protein YphA (DoxX/SURF4 family)